MWPTFLYMSKEESIKSLRQLELEAYSSLISIFRAQGPLTQEKRKILRETGRILNITADRHKTEVRRAVNDEKLNTIAYHIHGPGISSEDWCQEGRRVLPMLQRISPQTLHPIITDTFSSSPSMQQNYQEIGQSNFERKKLSGEGNDLMFKNSEKMDYLQAFPNDDDSIDQADDVTSLNPDYSLKNRPLITKSSFYRQSFGTPIQDSERITKIYPNKKPVNKNQHLMIVSNTQTIPTNSILHKTLSVPISKVTKLNLDKFKIVSSSSLPSSIHVSNLGSTENAGTTKHKFFTAKSGKKVIPLSQLQMLNHKLGSKGIKVLPLNSKLFGKNITMTRITSMPGLTSTVSFPVASTSNKEEVSQKYENNLEEKKTYGENEDAMGEKQELPKKKKEEYELLECTNETSDTISKIKIKEGKDLRAADTEGEIFRTEETEKSSTEGIESEDYRIEETENSDFRAEETESGDLRPKEAESEDLGYVKTKEQKNEPEKNEGGDCKTERKCFTTEENEHSKVDATEANKIKIESTTDKKLMNDKEDTNRKTDDDLAALMEIDSSEFIEPELKDALMVKKEV